MSRSARLYFPAFLICLSLMACGQAAPEALPPEEIITRSVERMTGLDSFHFLIDRSGAPAYLDDEESLSFSRAEGDFITPDRATAKIRIIAPGLVAELSIVGIGESYWETNLLSGQWQELPPGTGFNPAVLFDPQRGLQPVLENDLTDLQLVGIEELEELPGQKLYTLTGRLAGENLYAMSYEMIGPEPMNIQLWVAPETFELYRIIITEPTADPADPSIWQFDFWNFNIPVTIEPPIVTP